MWVGFPEEFGAIDAFAAEGPTRPDAYESLRAFYTVPYVGNTFYFARRLAYLIQIISAREELWGFLESDDGEATDENRKSVFTMRDRITQEKNQIIIPDLIRGGDYTAAAFKARVKTVEDLIRRTCHAAYFHEILVQIRNAFERMNTRQWEIGLGAAMYGSKLVDLNDDGSEFNLNTTPLINRGIWLGGGGKYPFAPIVTTLVDTQTEKWQDNEQTFYLPTDKLLNSTDPNTGGWNDQSDAYLTGPDTDRGYFKAMRHRRGWNNWPPDRQILSEMNWFTGVLPARSHHLFYSSGAVDIDQAEYVRQLDVKEVSAVPAGSLAFWGNPPPIMGGYVGWDMDVLGVRLSQHHYIPTGSMGVINAPWAYFRYGNNTTIQPTAYSFDYVMSRFGWQGNSMGKVWNGTIWQWFCTHYGKVPKKLELRFSMGAFDIGGTGFTVSAGMYANALHDQEGIGKLFFLTEFENDDGLVIPMPDASLLVTSNGITKDVSFDCTEVFQNGKARFPLYLAIGGDPRGFVYKFVGRMWAVRFVATFDNGEFVFSQSRQLPTFGF